MKALAVALALFAAWTAATWLLEGRLETLLRPDAVIDRFVYALVANLVIGTIGSIVVLRTILRWGVGERMASGFGPPRRTALAVLAGACLGLLFYFLAGAPTMDPVVIANAFAQVFVTSVAEILVCWAVVASVVEAVLRRHGRWPAMIGASVIASLLFGLYHFAHSAPFDSVAMVAFLSVVGLATSAFFLVSRDVYGTIVAHNFLGVLGVVKALAAEGQLGAWTRARPPLLVMAVVTALVLIAADRLALRRDSAA